MKRSFSILFSILLLSSALYPIVNSNYGTLKQDNQIFGINQNLENPTVKKWTFMLYDDADFYWAFDPLNDFASEAYSTKNASVLVLQDKEHGPAKMWYIDENHNLALLKNMGELNMGDSSTLKNFVEYSKNEYPAERYILAMYNHGMGWEGSCIDDSNNGDHLTMDEIQKSLTESGGIDILCFTAPCSMGAVESVYELRNCIDVFIGSEEESGYCYWRDTMSSIFETLNENSDISNIELSENIIQWIAENADNTGYGDSFTMSAIRAEKIQDLVASMEKFCKYLYENFNETFKNVKKARKNSKKVGYYYNGVDFLDFIQNYNDIVNNQNISQIIQNITVTFNQAIIEECHGIDHEGDYGLSIYFPTNKMFVGYNPEYNDPKYGLDFSRDTSWGEFLIKYVKVNKAKLLSFNMWFHNLLKSHPFLFLLIK